MLRLRTKRQADRGRIATRIQQNFASRCESCHKALRGSSLASKKSPRPKRKCERRWSWMYAPASRRKLLAAPRQKVIGMIAARPHNGLRTESQRFDIGGHAATLVLDRSGMTLPPVGGGGRKQCQEIGGSKPGSGSSPAGMRASAGIRWPRESTRRPPRAAAPSAPCEVPHPALLEQQT